MPAPKRLSVIEAIRDKLKEITVANGYDVDLEGRVYLGRVVFGEESKAPYVTIFEPFDEAGPTAIGPAGRTNQNAGRDNFKDQVHIKFVVQGLAGDGDDVDNPTVPAYELNACIQKCLGALVNDPRSVGARELIPDYGIVRPADNVSLTQPYCWINLLVKIMETRGNPYATE